MNREALDRAWKEVIEAENTHTSAEADVLALFLLLRGAICTQLGMWSQAENHFEQVRFIYSSVNYSTCCQWSLQIEAMKKDLKEEGWYVFYARYELAMLWYRQDGKASSRVQAKLLRYDVQQSKS